MEPMDSDYFQFDSSDYPVGWRNTQLEHFEVAHMACRAAWLWPEDHVRRAIAVAASHQCGVDYIQRLERLINLGTDMPTARWQVAEAFRHRADELNAEEQRERMRQESLAARQKAWEDAQKENEGR